VKGRKFSSPEETHPKKPSITKWSESSSNGLFSLSGSPPLGPLVARGKLGPPPPPQKKAPPKKDAWVWPAPPGFPPPSWAAPWERPPIYPAQRGNIQIGVNLTGPPAQGSAKISPGNVAQPLWANCRTWSQEKITVDRKAEFFLEPERRHHLRGSRSAPQLPFLPAEGSTPPAWARAKSSGKKPRKGHFRWSIAGCAVPVPAANLGKET